MVLLKTGLPPVGRFIECSRLCMSNETIFVTISILQNKIRNMYEIIDCALHLIKARIACCNDIYGQLAKEIYMYFACR